MVECQVILLDLRHPQPGINTRARDAPRFVVHRIPNVAVSRIADLKTWTAVIEIRAVRRKGAQANVVLRKDALKNPVVVHAEAAPQNRIPVKPRRPGEAEAWLDGARIPESVLHLSVHLRR